MLTTVVSELKSRPSPNAENIRLSSVASNTFTLDLPRPLTSGSKASSNKGESTSPSDSDEGLVEACLATPMMIVSIS